MGPVEALDAALSQHLSAIQRAAIASAPGGSPEWDGVLRHYGVPPLDAQERGMIVSCMHLSRGAVPAEFRVVIEGLAKWAQREVDGLRANPQAAMNPMLHGLQQRVGALVEAEIYAYERALGIPPPPPMPAAAPAPPPPIPRPRVDLRERASHFERSAVGRTEMEIRRHPQLRPLRRPARAAARLHVQILPATHRWLDQTHGMSDKKRKR